MTARLEAAYMAAMVWQRFSFSLVGMKALSKVVGWKQTTSPFICPSTSGSASRPDSSLTEFCFSLGNSKYASLTRMFQKVMVLILQGLLERGLLAALKWPVSGRLAMYLMFSWQAGPSKGQSPQKCFMKEAYSTSISFLQVTAWTIRQSKTKLIKLRRLDQILMRFELQGKAKGYKYNQNQIPFSKSLIDEGKCTTLKIYAFIQWINNQK